MLLNERHQKILNIVGEKASISSQALAEMLYVSPATIRRDLSYLHNKGLIKKSHGFAHSVFSTQVEYTNLLRAQSQVTEKKKIAEKCIDFLRDEFTYFIDSSTTVSYVIPYLSRFSNITVITNGLDTANQLSYFTQFHLFLVGGAISFSTNSTVGSDTVEYIKNFHSNIFLFSCNSISANGGVMEASFEQMRAKSAMLTNSKMHILLVDHTKFDKLSPYTTCGLNEIDILITDKMPSQDYIDAFDKYNVKLIVTN